MAREMRFFVIAEPKHMDHLHAFYVAGRIASLPSVSLNLPPKYQKVSELNEKAVGKEVLARMLLSDRYVHGPSPQIEFNVETKAESGRLEFKENAICTYLPFTGDSLHIRFGPCSTESVQTVHDRMKKFIKEEAEKTIPRVEDIGGTPHFHVKISPDYRVFYEEREVPAKKIEDVLKSKGLERTGEIAHFDVCGYNGYTGRIAELTKDDVPFGILEWEHGERSGVWDRYYLSSLRE